MRKLFLLICFALPLPATRILGQDICSNLSLPLPPFTSTVGSSYCELADITFSVDGILQLPPNTTISPFEWKETYNNITKPLSGDNDNITISPSGIGVHTIQVIFHLDTNMYTKVCTLVTPINVVGAPKITGDTTNVSCNGLMDGKIVLTIDPEGDNYQFVWSNTAETDVLMNLVKGTYEVTVMDRDNGCSATKMFDIQEPNMLSITLAVTDVTCRSGSNGKIDLTTNGGTPPYEYLWYQNAADTISIQQNIENLKAGTYFLLVRDKNGCEARDTVQIIQPLSGIEIQIDTISHPVCKEDSNGLIAVSTSGGTGVISYQWSDQMSDNDSLFNIPAGSYTVTVTDEKNCTETLTVTLTEPDVQVELDAIINVLCNGSSTGAIQVSASGQQATDLTYNWFSGNNPISTNEDLQNVPKGDYRLELGYGKDGCKLRLDNIVISEPPPLVIGSNIVIHDVRCHGQSTGSITLSGAVSGGTLPYEYNWSNSTTTPDLQMIPAGIYAITVTDMNHCTSTNSYTIVQPPKLVIEDQEETQPVNCGDKGKVKIVITGGTSPYDFKWNGGSQIDAGPIFEQELSEGNYSITITDKNDCSVVLDTIKLISPNSPVITLFQAIEKTRCDANTGQLNVVIEGGMPPFSITLKKGGVTVKTLSSINNLSLAIPDLSEGTYSILVTDAKNCQIESLSATIVKYDPPVITQVVPTGTFCGQADGTLNVVGGQPQYTYKWSNGSTMNPIANLTSGDYSVTITDPNTGCSILRQVSVPSQPIDDAVQLTSTPAGASVCRGDLLSFAILNPKANWVITWSPVTGANSSINIPTLSPGMFSINATVEVPGIAGCKTTKSANYTVRQKPDPTATSPNQLCVGDAIVLKPNGSIPPASTYKWTPGGQVTDAIEVFSTGNYTVTVTKDGCVGSATFVVDYKGIQPPLVDIVHKSDNTSTQKNHILIYPKDSLCYQWGYMNGLVVVEDPADSLQYWFLKQDYQPARPYYVKIRLKDLITGICDACEEKVNFLMGTSPLPTASEWYFKPAPNPSLGQFDVIIRQPESRPLQLRVFSTFGTLESGPTLLPAAQAYRIPVDLSDRTPGVYHLVVEHADTGEIIDRQSILILR